MEGQAHVENLMHFRKVYPQAISEGSLDLQLLFCCMYKYIGLTATTTEVDYT